VVSSLPCGAVSPSKRVIISLIQHLFVLTNIYKLFFFFFFFFFAFVFSKAEKGKKE